MITIGTMGALVAYTVGNSRAVALAHTPDIRRRMTTTYSLGQSQEEKIRFDISPDSLDVVLTAFQKVTGLQVIVPNEAIRNIQSPGVSGVYTTEQALEQLLTGTGVSYSFTALKTVTLEIRARPGQSRSGTMPRVSHRRNIPSRCATRRRRSRSSPEM